MSDTRDSIPEIRVGRYGLREFRINRRHKVLTPIAAHHMRHIQTDSWRGGTCIAVCGRGNNHPSPHPDCTCGIYASNYVAALPWHGGVIAVIAAEGDTIVGDDGFRTAAARIVAYWIAPDLPARLGDIVRSECVDAAEFTDFDAMVSHYHLRHSAPPTPQAPAVTDNRRVLDRAAAHATSFVRIQLTSASSLYRVWSRAGIVMIVSLTAAYIARSIIDGTPGRRVGAAHTSAPAGGSTPSKAFYSAVSAVDRLVYQLITATPLILVGLCAVVLACLLAVACVCAINPPSRPAALRETLPNMGLLTSFTLAAACTYALVRGWSLHPLVLVCSIVAAVVWLISGVVLSLSLTSDR